MNACLTKTDWAEVKDKVKCVNNKLYEIIDEINPVGLSINFVKYPYGMTISDSEYFYMPDENGGIQKLSALSFPYTILLENNLEIFLDTPAKVIPSFVYTPGVMFPLTHEVELKLDLIPLPKSVYKLTSGIRNIVMMPLGNENRSYYNLANEYQIPSHISPLNPSHHHEIFTQICTKENIEWHSSMLMLGDDWKENISNNPKWHKLKTYLFEQAIKTDVFKKHAMYLSDAMSDIASERKLHHHGYTSKLIKQILFTAIGDIPGFRPVVDESGLPYKQLTEAFNNCYNSPTTPIFVEMSMYDPNDQCPIYHSICAVNDNYNDKKTFNPIKQIGDVAQFLPVYLEAFNDHMLTKGTIFSGLQDYMINRFYSERGKEPGSIKESKMLMEDDCRFLSLYEKHQSETIYGFPQRSIFNRGLTSIEINL